MHGMCRKQEGTVVLLQAISHTVSRGVVPLIFNLSGIWRCVVIFMLLQHYSRERKRYP